MNWASLLLVVGGIGLSIFLLIWYLLFVAGSRSSRNEAYVEAMLDQTHREKKGVNPAAGNY